MLSPNFRRGFLFCLTLVVPTTCCAVKAAQAVDDANLIDAVAAAPVINASESALIPVHEGWLSSCVIGAAELDEANCSLKNGRDSVGILNLRYGYNSSGGWVETLDDATRATIAKKCSGFTEKKGCAVRLKGAIYRVALGSAGKTLSFMRVHAVEFLSKK